MFNNKLIVLCLLKITKFAQLQKFCNSTTDNSNNVTWAATSDQTLSHPFCLNESKEPVYRQCLNGVWQPKPECKFLQPEQLSECPDGFTDNGNLCYGLTSKSTYFPKCPFEDVVPFKEYKDIVDSNNFGPIWVPAKRDGFNFVKWREASWNYMTEVQDYTFATPIKDKECLIYFKKSLILVSCNEHYQALCAYKKLNQITRHMCRSTSRCRQSGFSPKSNCFCKTEDVELLVYPKADFLQPYQFSVYTALTNESCSIGLLKYPDGKYIWAHTNQEISYTYWSDNVSFQEGNVYGALTPSGWILTKELLSCIIFQVDIEILEPRLYLKFNEVDQRFFLTVVYPQKLKIYDSGILLFCFTNVYGFDQPLNHSRLPIIKDNYVNVSYAFYPLQNISGDYWCQAFKQIDLNVITSNRYFFQQSEVLEFVGIFKVCYESHMNPLSSQINNYVVELLSPSLSLEYITKIRPSYIIDLDENTKKIWINIHFTTFWTKNEEDRFTTLYKYLTNLCYDNELIDLIKFSSSDFCTSESDSLTWPKTPLGAVAEPKEFCFTSDGVLATRICDGNFIEGAQWSTFKECEIFEQSSLTKDLLLTVNSSTADSLSLVNNISKNYQQFNPLDVYLVAQIYSSYLKILNIDAFVKTINNFLNINKSVMKEAQLKLRATDKLLYIINRISFAYENSFWFYYDNFAFISSESQNFSGLSVVKEEDKFTFWNISKNSTLDQLLDNPNLESAIWLSSEYQELLGATDKVTFSVYLNDNFFLQKEEDLQINFIFGMSDSPSINYFNGPVFIIQRMKQENNVQSDCAFWGYSLKHQGSWKHFGAPQRIRNFLVCAFWQTSNFAIITSKENNNVTTDLCNVLQSNDSAIETIEKLSFISEKHKDFQSVDVSYVGQILRKISTDENVSFSNLAKTISNIQQIKRDVLLQSQIEQQATDKILTYVDAIIKIHSFIGAERVVSENFMIFVLDLKDGINGVALLRQDSFFDPHFLTNNMSITETVNLDNFDSAVLLSVPLQNQLVEETKIIFTIYFTDTLFNEKSSKRYQPRNTIFDIILPKIEHFAGPISLLYKKTTDQNTHQCVYWYYSEDISGSWRKDGSNNSTSNLIQCDFWHNTQFTFLILDTTNDALNVTTFLDVLTSVNSLISLVSLNFIFLTAIFFKKWRNNTGNKILLNFTFVMILQIVVFYISVIVDQEKNYISCILVGILLHYCIVSQFCWMLVIAILQFRRLVIVLEGPPRFILLKACVCGWVLPLVPVIGVFATDRESYVKSKSGLCYPSDYGLYLGVWLPICLIILINFVIFSITLYNIASKKTETFGSSDVLYQWRLAVLLFFLLGFTWSFGFLAEFNFGLVFEYFFCMTATLQGFILFLFFIVCNANTRKLYAAGVKRCWKGKF